MDAPTGPRGSCSSAPWGQSRRMGTTSALLLRARPGACACGAGGDGGPAHRAGRQRKRPGAWSLMKGAKPPAGRTICGRGCSPMACGGTCKCAWGQKAPALPVSQGRTGLAVLWPWRTSTGAEALARVAWGQRGHHRASLSPRRRRAMAREIARRREWRLRPSILVVSIESLHLLFSHQLPCPGWYGPVRRRRGAKGRPPRAL